MTPDSPGRADGQAPTLRLISGCATDEEIAAIVAVITSAPAPSTTQPASISAWSDPARRLRGGPAWPRGWRDSALPQ